MEELKKIEEERQKLLQTLQQLENEKGQIITRLAEIQGVIKYISENKKKK